MGKEIVFAATQKAKDRLAAGVPDERAKPYECEKMKRARQMAQKATKGNDPPLADSENKINREENNNV